MKPFSDKFLDECKGITEQYDKIMGTWSQDSQLLHVITEVTEVKDVLRNKNEKYGCEFTNEYTDNLLSEVADIFLTALSLTNILQISNDDLNMALITKLSIVKNRVKELQKNKPRDRNDRY